MSHHLLVINDNEANRDGRISGASREIRIGGGSLSDNYSNSGATSLNNATLEFYDPSPANNIAGATITSASGWISAVTLPAGTYLLEAAFALSFSASGQFSFQWYDGTNSRGTRAQIGATLSHVTESVSPYCSLCITISSNTTFSVRSTSGSTNLNTIANQGVNNSEQSYIKIREF
jgi:translation initiation factor IF-1